MTRLALVVIACGLVGVTVWGQPPRRGGGDKAAPSAPPGMFSTPCPICEEPIKPPPDKPNNFQCPHCKADITVEDVEGNDYLMSGRAHNKYRMPVIIGGSARAGVAVLWYILSNFVLAKPEKKKKKRPRDDDDDYEDDDEE